MSKKTLTLNQLLNQLPPLETQIQPKNPDEPLFSEGDLTTLNLFRLGMVRVIYDPEKQYTKLTEIGGTMEQVGAVTMRSAIHSMDPAQVSRLRGYLLGMISTITQELKRGEEKKVADGKKKIQKEVADRDAAKVKQAIADRETQPKILPKAGKKKLSPEEKAIAAMMKAGLTAEYARELLKTQGGTNAI